MISDAMPLVNFVLLCWLVCWSIITERRMWYLKTTMERSLLTELTMLRSRIADNSEDIGQMRVMIQATIARVDAAVTVCSRCDVGLTYPPSVIAGRTATPRERRDSLPNHER